MSSPTPPPGQSGDRDPAMALRRNHRILAPEVQVISPEGQALGIMPTKVAINRALEMRLDLVEMAPNAHPPVCRIMDFGKYISDRAKDHRDGA